MTSFTVVLKGGSPWGFRITGGREFNEPITVSKINPNSKAYNEGIKVGDVVNKINGQTTHGLNYADAQQLIKNATEQLLLDVHRGDKPPNIQLNGGIPSSSPPKPQKVDTGQDLNSELEPASTSTCAIISSISTTPTTSTSISTPPTIMNHRHYNGGSMVATNSKSSAGLEEDTPKYSRAIKVPHLSPAVSSHSSTSVFSGADRSVHSKDNSDLESQWSERGSFEQAGPAPSDMGSKRPALPPPIPKQMKHKPLYETQAFSGYGTDRSAPSPMSHSWSLGRSSSVGRDSRSSHDSKSRGMNLFRRQQEKLAKMGADVQEINVKDSGFNRRPYEPPQAYSAQSSPGGVGPYAAGRSLSVDESARNVPIIVQASRAPGPQPLSSRPRTHSESENANSFYHVRPAHDPPRSVQDSGFSSWQSGLSDPSHAGRNFGVGSYATLPAKSSSSHHHHQPSRPHQQQRQPQQQQPPPAPVVSSAKEVSNVPVNQPLSVDADQPINDFDYHIYSTLPTIKPLRSGGRRGPLDLPDLEREKKFQDFSQPLWTNTDLPEPTRPSRDDSRSPPSDNAVSSSDSRDTIIARSDETRSSHTDSTLKAECQPMMIPVRVVHEDSGRSPGPDTDMSDQPWGKRVVEGADQTFPNLPSEPSSSFQEKPPEHQLNGLKSPGFSSTNKPGIWSPGVSPSSIKSEPVRTTATNASPPGSSLKNIAPIWKPSGSPGGVRKEYRPVRLNTSAVAKPSERRTSQDQQLKPEETYAWQPRRSSSSSEPQSFSGAAPSSLKYSPMSTGSGTLFSPDAKPAVSAADTNSWERRSVGGTDHSRTNGSVSDNVFDSAKDDEVRLPSTQSPYITLLQKSRENETQGDLNFSHIGSKKPIMVSSEGRIPKGAKYLGEKVTVDGDKQHTDTYYSSPTQETTATTKKVEQKPVVYDGIGPIDKEGVPLAFRKNVQEEKQHDWYRQMYRSLHKKKKEDQLGINDMIDTIFEKAGAYVFLFAHALFSWHGFSPITPVNQYTHVPVLAGMGWWKAYVCNEPYQYLKSLSCATYISPKVVYVDCIFNSSYDATFFTPLVLVEQRARVSGHQFDIPL